MGSNVSNEGSVGVGFALGFFLGLIGLAVSFFVLNAPATKKGSIYGLAAQFVMGFVLASVVPAVLRP